MHKYICLGAAAALTAALSLGVATATAGNGGNSGNAKLCQKGGWQTIYPSTGQPFSSEGACVSYGALGGAYSALVVTTPTYACSILPACFGHLHGTGLAPNAEVDTFGGTDAFPVRPIGVRFADANGSIDIDLGLVCTRGWFGVYATSTMAANLPITSNTVSSPCG